MKCPTCSLGIKLDIQTSSSWANNGKNIASDEEAESYRIAFGHCPSCGKLIILLQHGLTHYEAWEEQYVEDFVVYNEEIIHPDPIPRTVDLEVPERYRKDFIEAASVLPISPKATLCARMGETTSHSSLV